MTDFHCSECGAENGHEDDCPTIPDMDEARPSSREIEAMTEWHHPDRHPLLPPEAHQR